MDIAERGAVIAAQIAERCGVRPKIGAVLGSGWNAVSEALEGKEEIAYGSLDGMPVCGVSGHAGKFAFGRLGVLRLIFLAACGGSFFEAFFVDFACAFEDHLSAQKAEKSESQPVVESRDLICEKFRQIEADHGHDRLENAEEQPRQQTVFPCKTTRLEPAASGHAESVGGKSHARQ